MNDLVTDLVEVLKQYIAEYPVGSRRPVGEPDSLARHEQDRRIIMEDWALKAIARAEGV